MRSVPPIVALITLLAAGCGDPDPVPAAAFPADYRSSYTQVRGCRKSGDHDLNFIRVLADPAATGPYQRRDVTFPVGSVVLKEEFDFADDTCTGAVKQWTVMVRLASGASASTLDWGWQRVDAQRKVVSEDEARCINCHLGCGSPPDGYQGTCALP